MKTIKDELQDIILGDEQIGRDSQLKKIQSFLRGYAETSNFPEKQQRFKDEETAALIAFAAGENAAKTEKLNGLTNVPAPANVEWDHPLGGPVPPPCLHCSPVHVETPWLGA